MAAGAPILPGRYEEPRLVGRGGMGEIYLARDRLLGRTVAVKLLAERLAQEPELRERFRREALTAARLSEEPHVVTVYDVGEHAGRPFTVMEYLPGGTLAERAQSRPVEPEQALAWLAQAAAALDAAHGKGVVHRDVKPANLLFDGADRLQVVDFGIARVTDDTLGMTAPGTILGTAGYLAPEQALGRETTAASDRYALAVVAYELLTGGRPFARGSETAEAAAQIHDPSRRPPNGPLAPAAGRPGLRPCARKGPRSPLPILGGPRGGPCERRCAATAPPPPHARPAAAGARWSLSCSPAPSCSPRAGSPRRSSRRAGRTPRRPRAAARDRDSPGHGRTAADNGRPDGDRWPGGTGPAGGDRPRGGRRAERRGVRPHAGRALGGGAAPPRTRRPGPAEDVLGRFPLRGVRRVQPRPDAPRRSADCPRRDAISVARSASRASARRSPRRSSCSPGGDGTTTRRAALRTGAGSSPRTRPT